MAHDPKPYAIRSTEGLRRLWCPFCGLCVLGDDAEKTLHHEEPVCAAFGVAMRARGLSPVRVERTIFVDELAEPRKNVS